MLIALAGLLTDMRAEAPELRGSIIPAALGGTAVLAAVVLLPAGVAAHWGICTLRGTAWNMRRALTCSALATALHLLAATALAGAFCL
ncbi:MAG: hypothetical protein Q4F30_09475 [Akkermansia sp.]|nr:hypothetical protein [Akkermansia sp.]